MRAVLVHRGGHRLTTPCLGIRLAGGGEWQVYAPHGFADMFSLVVRPRPGHAPQSSYEAKARR
ncbi:MULTISPECIES: nucleotidyltransferase family protein [Amycolatopsis]|nr:nucleotidyltransferase family protein [Amycolatopsis sp. M39]